MVPPNSHVSSDCEPMSCEKSRGGVGLDLSHATRHVRLEIEHATAAAVDDRAGPNDEIWCRASGITVGNGRRHPIASEPLLAADVSRKRSGDRTCLWKKVARPKRFELLTPRFVVWCSIQLS